jgi:hypothetical protein
VSCERACVTADCAATVLRRATSTSRCAIAPASKSACNRDCSRCARPRLLCAFVTAERADSTCVRIVCASIVASVAPAPTACPPSAYVAVTAPGTCARSVASRRAASVPESVGPLSMRVRVTTAHVSGPSTSARSAVASSASFFAPPHPATNSAVAVSKNILVLIMVR